MHTIADSPPQVLVAQLGARMHYAVPRILHEAGMLAHLYTDICAVKGWPRLLRIVPPLLRTKGVHRLLGRVPRGVPEEKVTAFSQVGWNYVRALARSRTATDRTRARLVASSTFGRRVVAAGFQRAAATYTFNVAGLEIMQTAKELGMITIMEQTIAPVAVEQELLADEARKHPEWPSAGDESALAGKIDRERAEWELADVILCGSLFVKEGVGSAGGPVEKCVVVPYGVDTSRFATAERPARRGPLRVLTVGSVGLRKGTPYVLDAARRLDDMAIFRIVGPGEVPDSVRKNLPPNVQLMGQVPRDLVRAHFAWADVFLLPSICEGSAVATYEALVSGLPVVCTPNTGSLIRDGIDGFIVSPGTSDGIVDRLTVLCRDWERRHEMSESMKEQHGPMSIDAYGRRLVSSITMANRSLQQRGTVGAV